MGLSENEAPLTNTCFIIEDAFWRYTPIFEQNHIPFIWLNYNRSLLVAWKWLKPAAIWAWFPVYPCPPWGLDITTWGHDQLYPGIFIHINSISHIIGDFHCLSSSIPLMLVKNFTLFRQYPVFQVDKFHPVPHLRLGHPLEDVPHGPNGQDGRLSAQNGLSEPLRGCSKHVEIHGAYTLKGVYMYISIYIYIHHMLYWKNHVIRNYNKMWYSKIQYNLRQHKKITGDKTK